MPVGAEEVVQELAGLSRSVRSGFSKCKLLFSPATSSMLGLPTFSVQARTRSSASSEQTASVYQRGKQIFQAYLKEESYSDANRLPRW